MTINELTSKINHDHVAIGWKLSCNDLKSYLKELDKYSLLIGKNDNTGLENEPPDHWKTPFASDNDVTTKTIHCTNCGSPAHNLDWCPYAKTKAE